MRCSGLTTKSARSMSLLLLSLSFPPSSCSLLTFCGPILDTRRNILLALFGVLTLPRQARSECVLHFHPELNRRQPWVQILGVEIHRSALQNGARGCVQRI